MLKISKNLSPLTIILALGLSITSQGGDNLFSQWGAFSLISGLMEIKEIKGSANLI
jgi:hypothetical protein